MKNSLKRFLLSNWTLGEKGLLLADVLLFGVLAGWLTSPFRKTSETNPFTNPDLWDMNTTTTNCENAEEEEKE